MITVNTDLLTITHNGTVRHYDTIEQLYNALTAITG